MRKVSILVALSLSFSLGWVLRSAGRSQELSEPLTADPNHYHLEFENDRVRVTRAKVGPHEIEPMHKHSLPAVVVYITPQDIQRTLPDGTTSKVHIDAGVRWVEPNAHQVENLNDKPFEFLRIDLKAQ